MTSPRLADDFRRLAYDVETEGDRLAEAGAEVYRQIGYRLQNTAARLLRLADDLGKRESSRRSEPAAPAIQ